MGDEKIEEAVAKTRSGVISNPIVCTLVLVPGNYALINPIYYSPNYFFLIFRIVKSIDILIICKNEMKLIMI